MIVAFATQGGGGDDEDRLRTLLGDLPAEFFPFDKKSKADSLRELLNIVRQQRPELLIMEGTGVFGGLACLLSHWLYKTRYVFGSGDAIAPFLSAHWPAGKPLFQLYELLLCRSASGFISWTPYLTGRAITLGVKRAVTAAGWAPYSYTDEHLRTRRAQIRESLGIPADSIVFGIVGSLAWSKRLGFCYGWELVRAALEARAPNVKVLVVGDGEGRKHLEQIAGGELGKSIFLPGRVPRDTVPEYLAAMDVASLPQSVDKVGSLRYTTKISEYFGARLPFVTNQIPAAYDLDYGGLWRLPGDSPWDPRFLYALAKLMREITHESIDEKRRCIPAYVPEFDRQRQIAQVNAFLREILAG